MNEPLDHELHHRLQNSNPLIGSGKKLGDFDRGWEQCARLAASIAILRDAIAPAPVAWWYANMPDGWEYDVYRNGVHRNGNTWRANVWTNTGERVIPGFIGDGKSRDAALDAALRQALGGEREPVPPDQPAKGRAGDWEID